MTHAAGGEGGDHFGKLADLEPDDVVHQRGQLGVGLAVKGGGHQPFGALGAGLAGKEQRQRAIAGDDANGVGLLRHKKNIAAPAQREQLVLSRL